MSNHDDQHDAWERGEALDMANDRFDEMAQRLQAAEARCCVLEAAVAAMLSLLEWLGDEGHVEYHEQRDCPMDDTCTCEIAARFNAALSEVPEPKP